MLKKTYALALTVATAGLLGFAAPMASAATMSLGSNHPEIVNLSNNQVPAQACGNDVNTNGAGSQVLAGGDAVVGSLLSPGAVTEKEAVNNRGCRMDNNESNRNSDDHGLFNVANNQIPAQACGNDVNTNGAGSQVPLYGLDGAFALLSPKAITKSAAVNNQGCSLHNNESNKHESNKYEYNKHESNKYEYNKHESNKYEYNKYEYNKYEYNKYEYNKYEYNKYEHNKYEHKKHCKPRHDRWHR